MATETVQQENGEQVSKRVRRQPKEYLFQVDQVDQAKEILKQIPNVEGGAGFNVYKVTQGNKSCLVIATSPADAAGKAGKDFYGFQVENLTGRAPFQLTADKAAEFIKALPDDERNRILAALTAKPTKPAKR